MIVNQTPRGGFECGRQRPHPFGDVVVDQRVEVRRLVSDQEGVDEEEDLRLPLAEVPHDVHEQPKVALLLSSSGSSSATLGCSCTSCGTSASGSRRSSSSSTPSWSDTNRRTSTR